MSSVLVIGGTRFIGRHIVSELVDHGYSVTLLTRGKHANPFADVERVEHIEGDRREKSTLERAAEAVSPDIVIDTIAMFPADVRAAVDAFAAVDSYLYVSSVGAYDSEHLLKTEGRTPLVPCSEEEATDDSFATYAARKAEADRIVLEAAAEGFPAISVRPTMVYGPHNYLGFLQYWIDRVVNNDRVLVPGNGSYISHRTYVEDIGSAVRVILERGEAGQAYNIGDQRPLTIKQTIECISDVSGSDVEPVYASPRELQRESLSLHDFPLYMGEPFVLSVEKLAGLGWESTPPEEAMEQTITYHREHGLTEYEEGPSREDERSLIQSLS